LNVSQEEELAKNCFCDLRPDFASKVNRGDIIVAGENFGCGSSREHAPWAIKGVGISVVIAKGFARIFYRNAINIGLPLLESTDAADAFEEGEQVTVNVVTGEIKGTNKDQDFLAKPIPDFIMEMIQAGGLVNYIKKKRA
jgi:3-isopropylmalate/(R)-2-methylmalate dehydratase small subunit